MAYPSISRPFRTKFSGTEAPTPGEPPFKGLQYFDEADCDLFFGRELLTEKLMDRLRESRFLSVIIGASGSGKSSLVRAGLIPALKQARLASPCDYTHRQSAHCTGNGTHTGDGIGHRGRDPHRRSDAGSAQPLALPKTEECQATNIAGHRPVRRAVHSLPGRIRAGSFYR